MSEQTEPCKDDRFIPMHQQDTLLKKFLITSFVANFFYSGKISLIQLLSKAYLYSTCHCKSKFKFKFSYKLFSVTVSKF